MVRTVTQVDWSRTGILRSDLPLLTAADAEERLRYFIAHGMQKQADGMRQLLPVLYQRQVELLFGE